MRTKVRLTRKFAQRLNGVDLSKVRAGEEIEVLPHEADILIAEGWAVRAEETATANDHTSLRKKDRGEFEST